MKSIIVMLCVTAASLHAQGGWIESTIAENLSGAIGLAVGDMDGDGDKDCAAAGWNDGVVWLLVAEIQVMLESASRGAVFDCGRGLLDHSGHLRNCGVRRERMVAGSRRGVFVPFQGS